MKLCSLETRKVVRSKSWQHTMAVMIMTCLLFQTIWLIGFCHGKGVIAMSLTIGSCPNAERVWELRNVNLALAREIEINVTFTERRIKMNSDTILEIAYADLKEMLLDFQIDGLHADGCSCSLQLDEDEEIQFAIKNNLIHIKEK